MLLLAFGACKVEEANNDDDDGGSGGRSGNGGSSGNAGSGGGAALDCGDVPASGRCIDNGTAIEYCRTPPPNDQGRQGPPTTVRVDCLAGVESCRELADGTAACELDQAAGVVCRPGDTLCEGDTLRACSADGKAFEETDCAADGQSCRTPPQQPAQCVAFSSAGGNAPRLSGAVKFERRGMSETGPTGITVDAAWLDFVAIYNGDKYIGSDVTDADGKFDAELTEPANEDTTVYVFAMDFDATTQQPLVAVVRNDDPGITTQTSTDYWFWSNKDYQGTNGQGTITVDGDNATMSEFVIPERDGAGALRVFQWIRYGMLRLDDPAGLTGSNGLESTKGKPQQTVAVFWSPGVDSVCGACFLGKQGGGALVKPKDTTTEDHYDTLMQISGSNGSPTHWSYSVLSHETGHWTMANYSRSPGEGGQHFVGQASKPGLAWSEGWATAFGQWNSSDTFGGEYDPVYFDTQDGTTFWVNIATAAYTGGALQKPDPAGGIDQFINENVVSSMVWHLWHPEQARFSAAPGGTDAGTYAGAGDDAMFRAVQSDRILRDQYNRGYFKVDLVDFYDAVTCGGGASDGNVGDVSADVGFPWDSDPTCP
ncbi:MAG TPA: hypothetical protein VFS43_46340 [Polyangiaceae bacterium]|nr:hypothetical protein [Polyangiaceae bacterium]